MRGGAFHVRNERVVQSLAARLQTSRVTAQRHTTVLPFCRVRKRTTPTASAVLLRFFRDCPQKHCRSPLLISLLCLLVRLFDFSHGWIILIHASNYLFYSEKRVWKNAAWRRKKWIVFDRITLVRFVLETVACHLKSWYFFGTLRRSCSFSSSFCALWSSISCWARNDSGRQNKKNGGQKVVRVLL